MPIPTPQQPQASQATALALNWYALDGVTYAVPPDHLVITATGTWGTNSRVAAVRTNAATPITVIGYVQADIITGDAGDSISVANAKRGTISTGAGDDSVAVQVYSNAGSGNGWLIDTGTGNDTVQFAGYASSTEATLNLGDGNDLLTLSGLKVGLVDAGGGDDTLSVALDGRYDLYGGTGNDVLVVSLGASSVNFVSNGDGSLSLTVTGKTSVELRLSGIERIRFLGGAEALVADILSGHLPGAEATPAAAGTAANNWIVSQSSAAELLQGSDAKHDAIYGSTGDTLAGGRGDDWYYVGDGSTVVEQSNQGIDTVTYWGGLSYALPDNVENLILGRNATRGSGGAHLPAIGGSTGLAGYGNELNNRLTGDSAANILDAGKGDDILTGGGGADTFFVGNGEGHDTITDFTPGVDRLALKELFDWRAAAVDTASGVLLELPSGDSVLLQGVRLASLTDRDIAQPLDHGTLRMTFDEEFDGLSLLDGTGADGGTWRARTSYGTGIVIHDNDIQAYVSPEWKDLGLNPFVVENGAVTIEAVYRPDLVDVTGGRPYISGMLTTHGSFAQLYGYFEARIQLPEDAGMYPAFWLLPTDGSWPPELDVVESTDGKPGMIQQMELSRPISDYSGWHTYGLEWTADRIAWYVDGVMTQVIYGHSVHTPMYLLLNLSVGTSGGALRTQPDAAEAGDVVGSMTVDWVHVYQSLADASPQATIAEGAPDMTLSVGAILPGGTPAAENAFHLLADTTAKLNFSDDDLGLAGLTDWNNLYLDNDRAADSLTATLSNGWAGMNLQLSDSDGGTYALTGFQMVELALGGTKASSVTLSQVQLGKVTTGSGNDVVSIPELKVWSWDRGTTVQVSTGAGDDRITGWTSGSSGRLEADGGAGNDTIVGSTRADLIAGGDGSDLLTGGSGADIFVFRAGETGQDIVTDFTPGTDSLRFEGILATDIIMQQTDGGTQITLPGASILLQGVTLQAMMGGGIAFA